MKRLKSFIFFFLLLACCTSLNAQQKLNFSIASFQADKFDTSANIGNFVEIDGSGNKYAIIKVTSNNPEDNLTEFNFSFGNMASHVKDHDGELWIYVQRNAKTITISRNGYVTISKHDLGMTLEPGQVYKMQLTFDKIQQRIVYDVKLQKVKFVISPAVQGVMVMAKRQDTGRETVVGMTDAKGVVFKTMDFGKYTYRVMSSDNMYHPSEGFLTLNSSDLTHEEKVILRPNFAEISLKAVNGAEIFINNESKGVGTWNGQLTPGTYVVNCKLPNYRDSQTRLTVKEGEAQTVVLDAPEPITGTLVINTVPYEADINIDGKAYGTSPKIIKDILIGEHEVKLSAEGYMEYTTSCIVKEGEVCTKDITMTAKSVSTTITEEAKNDNSSVNYDRFGNITYTEDSFASAEEFRLPLYGDDYDVSMKNLIEYPMGNTNLKNIFSYTSSALYQDLGGMKNSELEIKKEKVVGKTVEFISNWNSTPTYRGVPICSLTFHGDKAKVIEKSFYYIMGDKYNNSGEHILISLAESKRFFLQCLRDLKECTGYTNPVEITQQVFRSIPQDSYSACFQQRGINYRIRLEKLTLLDTPRFSLSLEVEKLFRK